MKKNLPNPLKGEPNITNSPFRGLGGNSVTTLDIVTHISAPAERVFDLSRSIDLHLISTRHTNEKAIAGRKSGLIELGESVTWQAKHFGITQKLTSKITEFDYPNHFTDEMVEGAFQAFRHEHIFKSFGPNQMLMMDIFAYEVPYGIAGYAFSRIILARYMTHLLVKRNDVIRQIAEGDEWKKILGE
ncbi:hypothetical protein GCM10023149_27510 [Mucilaginibacter gynuensis]|uniref:Cell division protein n=1 Tax=Mucilaginibacter gynuensis TaxID=1302236 RepID=A0ABP8GJR0_9SPHI